MVSAALQTLLKQQQADGYSAVQGAVIAGSIPLREDLLNEMIRQSPLRNQEAVKELYLTIQGSNRVDLDLTVALPVPLIGPIQKKLRWELIIEEQIKYPDALALRIRKSESSFFGAVIALLVQKFGPLPPFVRWEGKLIEIDLEALLRQQAIGRELLPFIESAGIEGRLGKLVLRFRLKAA